MTPGSNLFKRAIRAIKPTTIQYLAYTDRTLNAARQWVPGYAAAVPITASVQMVARSVYGDYGLDFQKVYLKVFAATNIIDVQRDTSSDRFIWNGWIYQVDSNNDWFVQDGWVSCIAVRIQRVT